MSGGISVSVLDFAELSFDFDRVRCVSFTPFLVRNRCGCQSIIRTAAHRFSAHDHYRTSAGRGDAGLTGLLRAARIAPYGPQAET